METTIMGWLYRVYLDIYIYVYLYTMLSNNFNSQYKAISVLLSIYKPTLRVRSGEVALNCPVSTPRTIPEIPSLPVHLSL